MRKLLNYLFYETQRDKLPHLSHTLTDKFDPAEQEAEIQLVLMTGLVRDPLAAQRLMEKYDARTAADLLAKLPIRRINWRARLRSWLQVIEGSYASDPHRSELQRTIGGDRNS